MEGQKHEPKVRPVLNVLLFFMVLCAKNAGADLPAVCGSMENPFGPYDYRDPRNRGENLYKVEVAHFDDNVANLKHHTKCEIRSTCSSVAGDLGYVLRAFPNHHRALYAMVRYHLEGRDQTIKEMQYSVDCYFQRAIEFTPDDATVRMIHAYYLKATGDMSAARDEYVQALRLAPDSAEVNYNAGLFFLDLSELEKAREYAIRAYELGYPLPGLRNRLAAKGVDIDAEIAPD